jgi:hypothetical protein
MGPWARRRAFSHFSGIEGDHANSCVRGTNYITVCLMRRQLPGAFGWRWPLMVVGPGGGSGGPGGGGGFATVSWRRPGG